MEKKTKVALWLNHNHFIEGITIEDEASSPTVKNPDRKVVRVKWEDDAETIENVEDLVLVND